MIKAKIGRYEIVQVLGKGGMGIVYLAKDTFLQRLVALKLLSPHLASDETVVARFINEARISASLQHPNIVTVYEAGQDGDFVFIAMEYVNGKDLASLLRERGKFHPDETISILKAVASALDYAHQRGVIHRDIKPSNVLVSEDGVVKLMDFGIARVVGGERHTKTGVLVGTPEYMAPELWEGKDADKFSDLYSLGILAYELLTGEVPFTGDTPIAIGYKHVHVEVPRTGINEAVDEVLKIALAKERERRFQSATAFMKALERALRDVSVLSVSEGQSYGREQEKIVTDVGVYWIPKKISDEKVNEAKQMFVQFFTLNSEKEMSELNEVISKQRTKKQFLRISLIVLIATVLITLLATLSPIFVMVQEKTLGTECLSRIRDLQIALSLYNRDWDETMPIANRWTDAIEPYRHGPFDCPKVPHLPCGYAFYRLLSMKKLADITKVDETPTLYDSSLGYFNATDEGQSIALRHFGGTYVSFVDGHARWFSREGAYSLFHPPRLSAQSREGHGFASKGLLVRDVWIDGEQCEYCGDMHGDLYVRLSDGSIKKICDRATAPRISDDKKKVGWLEREVIGLHGFYCKIFSAKLYNVQKSKIVAEWDAKGEPPKWVVELWGNELE